MTETQDEVVRVATVFTAAEFAITVSYLEGNGIVVVAMPFQLLNNMPHLAQATGGVGVLVPKRQAQAAINLLIEADRGEKMLEGEPPAPVKPKRKPRKTGWLSKLWEFLFYIYFGAGEVAPPYRNGRVIHGTWQKLDDDPI
ncbi:hypothetical protein G6L28_03625 [Agrobacterium larrymoorei]|uniref:hypothetical protein n=1 Tax=Agrobacterium larrymoorei TaxID=160699 RepID=UPI001573E1DA|nr:hypothetical protein [Agrobacterium larrymoorei]NTJ41690.1 hypothetical protein [Agrobacterium larrymoorei]